MYISCTCIHVSVFKRSDIVRNDACTYHFNQSIQASATATSCDLTVRRGNRELIHYEYIITAPSARESIIDDRYVNVRYLRDIACDK